MCLNAVTMAGQIGFICRNSNWEDKYKNDLKALVARRFEDDHAPCIGSITPNLLPAYCQVYEEMFPYRDVLELRMERGLTERTM